VTIFELGVGVALLPPGRRKETLRNAVARVVRRFGVRIYPFDAHAANAATKLLEDSRAKGLGLHQLPAKMADLQIGGIAAAYNLQLATRNVADFEATGLSLVNPWEIPQA
jgi:predicted nucleic acid-binding protein